MPVQENRLPRAGPGARTWKDEPALAVGIIRGKEVSMRLEGDFELDGGGLLPEGRYRALADGDAVILEGGGRHLSTSPFRLTPRGPSSTFALHGVTIGAQFHWQRKQDERFTGILELLPVDGTIEAVNVVPVEEYLKSVISSEMNADSSLHFLRAHAVASRSWLLAQLQKSAQRKAAGLHGATSLEDDAQRLRWYDREDHEYFDVCADDHCQRYQGITSAYAPRVKEAVQSTRGMVLASAGQVCDARFSKCCGGMSESFENVWEPVRHEYLLPVFDGEEMPEVMPDLRQEQAAAKWIRGNPAAFCNTSDVGLLSQVLVQYDRETPDFYRWKVEYRQDELAGIVREKSGIDFGRLVDLVPLERGASGRLIRLNIVGTERSLIIGKELEIRRTLSRTHLYSAAFVVDALDREGGVPQRFLLSGAGWGHGVGLCQIGAAVMGERGFSYEQILSHYFPKAELQQWYQ